MAVIFCLSFVLLAEEDLLDNENWDDLLLEDGSSENESEELSVLDTLIHEKGMTFTESFSMKMGYSPGWDDPQAPGDFNSMPILKMSTLVVMDVQLTSHLRAYNSIVWDYPKYPLKVAESFLDYEFTPNLNMRFGQHIIHWGESRNFNHSDILDRLPEEFSGRTEPLILRLSMPLQAGSIEFLALTRRGSWPAAPAGEDAFPTPYDIGYGGKINFPVKNWDLSLYSFYHNDMLMRTVFNYKTTLFDKLEHYSEIMATTEMSPEHPQSERLWLSFNTAFYSDFFDKRLKAGVEYYYNDEERELDTIKDTFLLYRGHNAAMFLSYTFPEAEKLEFLFYGRGHLESQTGVLSPGLKWHFRKDLNIQSGFVYTFGPEGQGYMLDEGNLDPLDRPLLFFVSLNFSAQWKQHF